MIDLFIEKAIAATLTVQISSDRSMCTLYYDR